jgi:replication factor C large subunit
MLMRLWTDRYRPAKPEDIAGQQEAVKEVRRLLASWKPGTGIILSGPPGTGKTLLAELLAAERGDFLVRMDASDARSAKEVGETISESVRQQTLFHRGRLILMDEVDSMSGRVDRGGAKGIAKIIEVSRYPVLICANDIHDPKLRELKKVCKRVRMGKVPRDAIASYLRKVAKKEGVKVSDDILNGLARWSDGDMRSALLDFQMLSLGTREIDDEQFTSIGFRERKKELEDMLLGLMRTPSVNANRKAIRECDTDPDDIFLWLESNIYRTTTDADFIAEAYDKLSIADIYRGRVMKQQNWRFKAYMIDLMSGIASLRKGEFIKPESLRYPDRIALLARTRFRRMLMEPVVQKIAERTHCSMRAANFEYMPYIMFFARKGLISAEEFGFTPEEMDALKKYGSV